MALDGVKVTMTPGDVTVMSDERGNFLIENVPAGEYSLQFETPEFEPLTIAVRVGSQVRDINAVVLVPDVPRQMIDDAVFAEFDMETVDDAQALPTSLSASKDIFNNIASYKFSEMRFNVRGYDSQYQDVYMNGIRLNDALTGYTPWSLWSGLNDATRCLLYTSYGYEREGHGARIQGRGRRDVVQRYGQLFDPPVYRRERRPGCAYLQDRRMGRRVDLVDRDDRFADRRGRSLRRCGACLLYTSRCV